MTGQRSVSTIETKNPPPNAEIVGYLLHITKTIRQLQGLVLAPIGVSAGQDHFLLTLLEGGSRSSVAVGRSLNVRPSTVSKMADICERKGWVRRAAGQDDHRKVYLDLTDEGVAAAHKVQTVTSVLEKELTLLFADAADTAPVIRQMDAILAKMLSRLR